MIWCMRGKIVIEKCIYKNREMPITKILKWSFLCSIHWFFYMCNINNLFAKHILVTTRRFYGKLLRAQNRLRALGSWSLLPHLAVEKEARMLPAAASVHNLLILLFTRNLTKKIFSNISLSRTHLIQKMY